MGAKQSAAMDQAKNLVEGGWCRAAEAARRTELTVQAIYVSRWYKAWKAAQKQAKANPAITKGE